MIEQYLADKVDGERICVKQLFDLVLYPDERKAPSLRESREIGEILDVIPGWKRLPKVAKIGQYGAQRCWQKIGSNQMEITARSPDDLPF